MMKYGDLNETLAKDEALCQYLHEQVVATAAIIEQL